MLEYLTNLDHSVFRLINQTWSESWLDQIMPLITDLDRTIINGSLLYVVVALIAVWVYAHRGQAVRAIVAGVLAFGISDSFNSAVIKPYFARSRPEKVNVGVILRTHSHSGYSFPSNHAANSFAVANTVGFYFPVVRMLILGYAAAVAYSRVYCGVHFPSDVVAGALIGYFWSVMVLRFMGRMDDRWQLLRRTRSARQQEKKRAGLNQAK